MELSPSVFLICALFSVTVLGKSSYPADVIEDGELKTDQLIRKYNYPAETHFITTEDNYIVCVHRISNPGGKPILLQHGLWDSSVTYILMGPTQSLGYYLHDKGYDVWIGNARGNRYSRNHTKLNPDIDDSFWNFSWHEIAIFDMPAMIDYILQVTDRKKLFYVGHSQGTTVLFVMCSMRPEYNEKIILAHALAPVAFMKHVRTTLFSYAENFIKLPATRSQLEFMLISNRFKQVCLNGRQMEDFCINLIFLIMGKDREQFNRTKLPSILGHIPAGSSIKQLLHYLQLIDSNRFCQYDHEQNNQRIYGQSTPPDYPLEKVTVPIVLHYGVNDLLTKPIDVLRLSALLPNKVEVHKMKLPQWNHIDFIYAIDSRKLLYEHMETLNKKFE